MVFNSLPFIFFSVLFFTINSFLVKTHNNVRWSFFVVASFFFYGWWNWHYLPLIILSGLVDFFAAILIERFYTRKKVFLAITILINLCILSLFKYTAFFSSVLVTAGALFGITFSPHFEGLIGLALPIGISFYTFQSMSYTIDVYRGEIKPTKNILHFFSYLSLFPQLVAGPIVRAKNFLPQLLKSRVPTNEEKWNGLKLIAIGFFKKAVLADNIAPLVNSAFTNDMNNNSSPYWWIVMIGFSLQIYFDFSGYSDIARGLAKWMGLHFQLNFNHPYLSKTMKEFWSRWHISLSTWFRDYLYIPLGGSRLTKVRTSLNLLLTFGLSGLWHGAAWHFVTWGFLHGIMLIIERSFEPFKRLSHSIFSRVIKISITFFIVVIIWTFFRAETNTQAIQIIKYLFSFQATHNWGVLDVFNKGIIFIVLGVVIEIGIGISQSFWRRNRSKLLFKVIDVAVVSGLLLSSVYFRGTGQQFIYFQF